MVRSRSSPTASTTPLEAGLSPRPPSDEPPLRAAVVAAILALDLAVLLVLRYGFGSYLWASQDWMFAVHAALGLMIPLLARPRGASAGLAFSDLKQRSRRFLPVFAACLAGFALFGAAGVAGARLLGRPEEIQPPLTFSESMSPAGWFLGFIVIHPPAEELLYRAGVHGLLRPRLGAWPAILAGGAWFGFVHYLYGIPAPSAACYGFGGVALAWAYERTGSLLYPWLLHVLFNGLGWFASLHPEWFEALRGGR